jgi:hypothetical protein
VKKFLVTILALLYLASVTGANIHLHYCMGELVSWKINEKHSPSKCSKCGMTSKKGCCQDKQKFVKAEKDQKLVEVTLTQLKAPVTILDHTYYGYTNTYSHLIIKAFPYSHAPPDKHNVPVYISNCVFRI